MSETLQSTKYGFNIFGDGSGNFRVARSATNKTPEMVFRGLQLSTVETFLEAFNPNVSLGKVARTALTRHYNTSGAGPIVVDVDYGLPVKGITIDQGEGKSLHIDDGSENGVTISDVGRRGIKVAINTKIIAQYHNIEKFTSLEAATASTIWHEVVGHGYIKEWGGRAYSGHTEVFRKDVDEWNGISSQDILLDDPYRIQYEISRNAGYFTDGGTAFLRGKASAFNQYIPWHVQKDPEAAQNAIKARVAKENGINSGAFYLKEIAPGDSIISQIFEIQTFPITNDEGIIVAEVSGYYSPISGEFVENSRKDFLFERDTEGKIIRDGNNQPKYRGEELTKDGLTVRKMYKPGTTEAASADILIPGNPFGVDFSAAGGVIGQQLGRFLAGDNALVGIVSSATLQTLGDALGDVLDGIVSSYGLQSTSLSKVIDTAFDKFGSEFFGNLKSIGTGAVSSFLTAELVGALGADGLAGELLNTASGTVIGQIVANIAGGATSASAIFAGATDLTALGQAVGGFLGTKLASSLVSFDTVGGQLGAAVGSSIGTIAAALTVSGPAGIAAAAAFAFVGFIAGGLIGSVFGGTPRSGADVVWDENNQSFDVANVWSKKGGSKDAATNVAQAVASTYNAVLNAIGGILIHPQSVQAGNYGMRGKKFVYRPYSSREKKDITASFNGQHAMDQLIRYGVTQGLSDPDFQIIGGSVLVKRAFYNSIVIGQESGALIDSKVLFGDLALAEKFTSYLQNSTAIDALIAAESQSVFAAEWSIVFARSVELGLMRRHASDWLGGFGFFLDKVGAVASDSSIYYNDNPITGIFERVLKFGNSTIGESIDVQAQDRITGSADGDIIKLSGDTLIETSGLINSNILLNGSQFNGSRTEIDVVAVIDAGDGNDHVEASDRGDNILGGAGNDILFGGRLDDWLFGGDGDDILDAGSSDPNALGGDGNYLNGGAGNDILRGREGSDWLEGGEGTDTLIGGGGGDILAGGAGDGDMLQGGAGGDQYIFRPSDGADIIHDDPGNAGSGADDPITRRLAEIEAGRVKRDWLAADIFRSDGAPLGGDDSLVLGEGIGLDDIRLVRGGALAGTTDADLILQRMTTDAGGARVASGDQVIMKDWFNSLKRIEWLVFADGQAIRIGDFTSFIVGTNGNDVLIGSHGNDFVVGGDGDDLLDLLPGYDVGVGGKGRDFIAGDAHDDLIAGGDDDDRLLGGTGNDVVSGDAGSDDIYGGAGRDILSGGHGDDLIAGGLGDDVFRFRRGDGQDTIIDEYAGHWEIIQNNGVYASGYVLDEATNRILKGNEVIFDGQKWLYRLDYDYLTNELKRLVPDANGAVSRDATNASFENGDALEFDIGINVQDISFLRSGNDLYLGIGTENNELGRFIDHTDQIILKDWYLTDNRPIETFVFAATGKMNMETTQVLGGTDADNTIAGGGGTDWITGGAGNDTLSGAAGNDILNGNSGSDTLDGGEGADILYGGAGNDILHGGAGADLLAGGNGEDTASYAGSGPGLHVHLGRGEVSTGDAYNDTFSSIENLTGGQYGDRLAGDSGDNFIWGGSGWDNLLGNAGDDTYYFELGETGTVTLIEGAFTVEEAVGRDGQLKAGYQISKWERTGTAWAAGRYYWRLQVTSPDGEVVYDYDKYTVVEENGTQPPTPSGFIVNEGATAVGWLNGFKRTYSQQVTREKFDTAADGGIDTIEFGSGISLSNVNIEWNGNDLGLYYGNGTQRLITIKNQRLGHRPIDALQFADGLTVDMSNVIRVWNTSVSGTEGADAIFGGSKDETMRGLGGNDVLSGGQNADKLYGDAGDDILEGGSGADLLDGGEGSDTIRYVLSAAGVNIDLATAVASGGDADGDTIVSIENVTGSANHGDTLSGNAEDNILSGLGGDDHIDGRSGNDVLIGGAGNDTLIGGLGDDNIAGEDGNDIAYGGDGKDLIDGGAGADQLYGDAGDDQLIGGADGDLLDGGIGNDTLVGGAGDDTLLGGDGDDQLTGGDGNDQLQGGEGNDTYLFDPMSGQDVVIDTAGLNKIAFSGAVTTDRLWLVRSDENLIISVIGGNANIRVEGFFRAGNPSRMHSIVTQTHALYLDYAHPLIHAMTQHQIGTPAQMPDAVRELLNSYWHEQGKARPTAEPLLLTIDEDQVTSGLLTNVIDHDENIRSYEVITQPSHGSVTLDPATGQFVYTPNLNYYGSDSFVVRAIDADGHTVDAPVNLTIRSVNDRPHDIMLSSYEVDENTSGMQVGELSAADVDDPATDFGQHIFTTSDARFEIVNNRTLKLRDGVSLDYETEPVVRVAVNAIDRNGAGLVFTKVLEIQVQDLIDIIHGTENPETLIGAQGIDHIYGHGGNDTIYGRAGDDLIDGGAGNDTLYGEESNDAIAGNVGDDHLYGGAGADHLSGGDGFDYLFGEAGDDVLSGGGDNDVLYGGDGKDTLLGGDGDDMLAGNEGVDHYDGGAGNDSVEYSMAQSSVRVDLENNHLNDGAAAGETFVSIENVYGSTFAPNELYGNAVANHLEGGWGHDVLDGRAGDDVLIGGRGQDMLFGGDGSDHLDGGADDDNLSGGDGNDTLVGGEGNDTLYADGGDDILDGGAGNDVMDGGLGNDTYIIRRNSGSDTIHNFDPSGEDIDVIGYQDTEGEISYRDLWFTREGDDLVVSIIGTSTATRVVNWYLVTDAESRANYKIDFFIAGEWYTKTIDAEELVDLMDGHEQPADTQARDALFEDPDFIRDWSELWDENLPPEVDPVGSQVMAEDGTLQIVIRATDDVTPHAGLQVSAIAVNPADGITPDNSLIESIVVGPPNSDGTRTLTIRPKAHVHGLAMIQVLAVDAGSVVSERRVFQVQINAVADEATITRAADVHATSGTPIALDIEAAFPDMDGSETHTIFIGGIPSGISLSAGVYDGTTGYWRLTPAQLSGLKLNSAAGDYRDFTLSVFALSRETSNGHTAESATRHFTVRLNAAPTGVTGWTGRVAENAANGTVVGTVHGVDPDGDTLTYQLLNSAGGRFQVNYVTGVVTVLNGGGLLDYEAAAAHVITVRMTDALGVVRDHDLTVYVDDVNEPNAIQSSYVFDTAENQGAVYIGQVGATDIDRQGPYGTQKYYFWVNGGAQSWTADGYFTIDENTGQIYATRNLDHETMGAPSYVVVARDNAGHGNFHQVSTTVTIRIGNSNDTPVLHAGPIYYVDEGVGPNGQVLISLPWDDQDGKSGHNFTIVSGNTNNTWWIDAAGNLRLNSVLDYETVPEFSLQVKVTDPAAASATQTYTIRLNDKNDPPLLIMSVHNYSPNVSEFVVTIRDQDHASGFQYYLDPSRTSNGLRSYRHEWLSPTSLKLTFHASVDPGMAERFVATFVITDPGGASTEYTHHFEIAGRDLRPGEHVPPVIFDLDGDGIELTEWDASGVDFDMNGDGIGDRTGWVSADDGFLVLDRNRNGLIDDSSELSFTDDLEGAQTDLEGLRAFDTNGNGLFDQDDAEFHSVRIWQDANQDGVSQPSELRSLLEHGITAINLLRRPTGEDVTDKNRNVVSAVSEYFRTDGTIGKVGDVMLSYQPGETRVAPPIILDLDGNGLNLVSLAASPVLFDMDGDGQKDRTGWAGPGDAFLVMDRNANGIVDDISEISFVQDLAGAKTDLEGLRAYDSNGDGVFSSLDQLFHVFKIWTDNNQNGLTDAGELKLLSDVKIASIDLAGKATGATQQPGQNILYNTTTFTRENGSTGSVGDVGLAYTQAGTGRTEVVNAGEDDGQIRGPEILSFDQKAKKYWLETSSGQISVRLRKTGGIVSPLAGSVDGYVELGLKGTTLGYGSTVVLDMDGDGLEMKRRKKARAAFDMNGDGSRDDAGWVGKGDAFLALDRNGNGRIDGLSEISFVGDKAGARSSLDGLGAYDSNRDGKLDNADARFAEFLVWNDVNGNGVSEYGELVGLAAAGIKSIGLQSQAYDARWKLDYNVVASLGTFTRTDGHVGSLGDVALGYKPAPAASGSDVESLLAALAAPEERSLESLRAAAGGRDAAGTPAAVQTEAPDLLLDAGGFVGIADHGAEARLSRMVQAMALFGGDGSADLERYRPLAPMSEPMRIAAPHPL